MEARLREIGSVLIDCTECWGHQYWKGYRWREPEWEGLWKTIIEAYGNASRSRYLGQIILKPFQYIHKGPDLFLIDGLQRLLTIIIMLKAMEYQPIRPGTIPSFSGGLRAVSLLPDTSRALQQVLQPYDPPLDVDNPFSEAFRYFFGKLAAEKEGFNFDGLVDTILRRPKAMEVIIDIDEDTKRVYDLVNPSVMERPE